MILNVSTRKDTGKGASRQYRNTGKIPGIVYGNKTEPSMVVIDLLDLNKFIKANGTSRMLTLSVEGAEKMVLFKDIDRDPLTDKPYHVDFLEIDQNKEVERVVNLNFVGTPVGVSAQGGVLLMLTREIKIKCLPKHIPEKAIDVDIQNLELNASLHASSINFPSNIVLSSPADTPIVSVIMPKEEKVAAPAEPVEGAEGEAAAAAATATPADAKKEPELVDQKGKKDKEEPAPEPKGKKGKIED